MASSSADAVKILWVGGQDVIEISMDGLPFRSATDIGLVVWNDDSKPAVLKPYPTLYLRSVKLVSGSIECPISTGAQVSRIREAVGLQRVRCQFSLAADKYQKGFVTSETAISRFIENCSEGFVKTRSGNQDLFQINMDGLPFVMDCLGRAVWSGDSKPAALKPYSPLYLKSVKLVGSGNAYSIINNAQLSRARSGAGSHRVRCDFSSNPRKSKTKGIDKAETRLNQFMTECVCKSSVTNKRTLPDTEFRKRQRCMTSPTQAAPRVQSGAQPPKNPDLPQKSIVPGWGDKLKTVLSGKKSSPEKIDLMSVDAPPRAEQVMDQLDKQLWEQLRDPNLSSGDRGANDFGDVLGAADPQDLYD